jgi:peptidyl-tRNA hydrolase
MKMYIAVMEDISVGFAMAAVAHAAAAAMDKWRGRDEDFDRWFETSFKKVIVRVDELEFVRLKEQEDRIVMTESALDGAETAIVFKPREEYPKMFQFLKLYR